MQVGDVDFGKNFVVIRRQVFPGKGGLVTKPTKSRKDRQVPILEPLRPVLERLTKGKEPEDQLLVWPEGRLPHHRDRPRRHQLGQHRRGARPARPHPARPAPHRSDLDGRRRHPTTARAPRHPRARLDGNHPWLPTPDDRHLASAAEQARRSGPSARDL